MNDSENLSFLRQRVGLLVRGSPGVDFWCCDCRVWLHLLNWSISAPSWTHNFTVHHFLVGLIFFSPFRIYLKDFNMEDKTDHSYATRKTKQMNGVWYSNQGTRHQKKKILKFSSGVKMKEMGIVSGFLNLQGGPGVQLGHPSRDLLRTSSGHWASVSML